MSKIFFDYALVDMDATLQKFFEDVDSYTNKIYAMYHEPAQKKQLDAGRVKYKKLKDDIMRLVMMDDNDPDKYLFSNKIFGTEVDAHLFEKPNSGNYFPYRAFVSVIREITEYYRQSAFMRNPEKLLKAIKNWKYHTSTSLLKDFRFPFMPLTRFAERVKD